MDGLLNSDGRKGKWNHCAGRATRLLRREGFRRDGMPISDGKPYHNEQACFERGFISLDCIPPDAKTFFPA